MPQDEEYIYFTVGLLKNSFALDALRQDALKYHMIDQPAKLIALRLTEYYELMARGISHQGVGMSSAATPTTISNGLNSTTGQVGDTHPDDESVVAASPDAERNAEEAAAYWARL
jgi:hypothetical protein